MVYCWRTRKGSIGSQHTAAKESTDIAFNAGQLTEWPPVDSHNFFVNHVGQTGALVSEDGQVVLPGFNSNERTIQSACWRQPTHSSKGTQTTTLIDIASNAGSRTVFTKRPVISGWRRPGV